MNRRRFLGVGFGVGLAAGCIGSDQEDDYGTVQEFLLQKSPRNSDPSTVDLRIERENADEAVHEDTYELVDYSEVAEIDCVWPDEPLRLMARHAGDDEWSSHSTADWTGCASIIVDVSESATSFFVSTQECPHARARCHTDVGSD